MQLLVSRRFRGGAVVVLALAILAALGWRPAARALERYQRAQWHKTVFAEYNKLRSYGSDELPPLTLHEDDNEPGVAEDDATMRRLYTLAYYGNQATPDVSEQRFLAAQRESARWSALLPIATRVKSGAGAQANAVVTGQSWVNLGPTDARIQANGAAYNGIDSGRATTIRVDPRDKDIVYLATAWGGLWKTYNFTATQPSWLPVSDTIGALSVGAFEIDPTNPDVLYLGLGDALDTSVAGGAIYKSTDGGSSWTMLTARLSGTWPAATGGRTESAVSVMDIKVDAADAQRLLVATDVGLFRSTDGGATFTIAPLPNAANVEAKAWTIVPLGQSAWLVSGMYACATNQPPQPFGFDFPVGAALPSGATCTVGTLGDVWRSTDAGATWTSLRQTAKLPNTGTASNDYGRIALAVGTPKTPTTTVVYAQVSNVDSSPGAGKQLAIWKSVDGGQSWTTPAGSAGTAAPTNPTTGNDCKTMNLAHDQSWYNLAIAVDPTNDNNVLAGGNLCGARTTNGGTTWSLVAHWLPPNAAVTGGTLPYVHADWHAATVTNVGGSVVAFAGSDGGFFASKDLFSAATGQAVTWNYSDNRGIATHLFYGVSSGDPTTGDEQVVFGGLQDNGTRFRDLDPDMGRPTTFNQVVGGDGIGTALSHGPAGIGNTYFGSLPGSNWTLCQSGAVACSTDFNQWGAVTDNLSTTNDPIPFFVRYSPIDGDANGAVLTATSYAVFKLTPTAGDATSKRLSPPMTGTTPPHGFGIRNVYASPFTHTDCGPTGGQMCRLYGAPGGGGKFVVFTDVIGGTANTGVASPTVLGTGATKDKQLNATTGIAFPQSAAHFKAGAHDGQVYIVTTTAPHMADGTTLVPDTIGRVLITTDGGNSWTPFHGNGTSDLPNVPAQTVVFDPSDATDKTIFVGNDLGVYQTTDAGATWHRYGVGFPLVRVTEIRIAKNSGIMRVATYGRGIWEIYPNAMAAPGVRGNGDWDANLAIDFLDLGAMATRLGDTPATATQPYYDWHLDVAGNSANSIGEEDLTALVAKFGSHP